MPSFMTRRVFGLLLYLAIVAPTLAQGIQPVGDPIEANSWGQRFVVYDEGGAGLPDKVVLIHESGSMFSSPYIRLTPGSGWSITSAGGSCITIAGTPIPVLYFDIFFEGTPYQPLAFTTCESRDDTVLGSWRLSWDPPRWTVVPIEAPAACSCVKAFSLDPESGEVAYEDSEGECTGPRGGVFKPSVYACGGLKDRIESATLTYGFAGEADTGPEPVFNLPVAFFAQTVPMSGGHDHALNRPPACAWIEGESGDCTEAILIGNTGFDGLQFRVRHRWPEDARKVEVYIWSLDPERLLGSQEVPAWTYCIRESEDLVELPEDVSYERTSRNDPAHPSRYYGTIPTVRALRAVASQWFRDPLEPPILGFNDLSLPYGGIYDLNDDWNPPHCSHRFGVNCDVRTNNMFVEVGDTHTLWLPQLYFTLADAGFSIFVEDDHYHVTYVGGGSNSGLGSRGVVAVGMDTEAAGSTYTDPVGANVTVTVRMDDEVGLWRYSYKLENTLANGDPIDVLALRGIAMPCSVVAPLHWSGGTGFMDDSTAVVWLCTDLGEPPEGWIFTGSNMYTSQYAVRPGESRTGFEILSPIPPTVVRYQARLLGPIPGIEYDDSEVLFWAIGDTGLVCGPGLGTEPCHGRIEGDLQDEDGGLAGAIVDVFDENQQLLASTTTDASGGFTFERMPMGVYVVELVRPLGYQAAEGWPIALETVIRPAETAVVSFRLDRIVISAHAEGKGYWKHQYKVYATGNGNAQESREALESFQAAISASFADRDDGYSIRIPGLTYTDGSEYLSFEDAHNTLTILHPPTSTKKASAEYLALLLNIVSGKIATYSVVSLDGVTASQVVTYLGDLLGDGNVSNDSVAKTYAEMVNANALIPNGVIPLDTPNIAFRPMDPGSRIVAGVRPNPASGLVTLSYAVPMASSRVRIEIHDVAGRLVRVLADGNRHRGMYDAVWDGRGTGGESVASGVYFWRVAIDGETVTRQVIVMR